jgi:hypothetical protein
MRRELIQRYERKQNLSPPAVREAQQQRIERRKENSRITQPRKPMHEKQLENKQRRGK